MKAIEMLKEAILKGELGYYQATGSTAYVVEYEDSEQEIMYSTLSRKRSQRQGEIQNGGVRKVGG